MSNPESGRTTLRPPEGRMVDRSFVLAVAALILLTPPIITIFDVEVTVFGIPLLHVYCFAVWIVSIALGAWVSSRMAKAKPGGNHGLDHDPGP